jgi:hypothetical protein
VNVKPQCYGSKTYMLRPLKSEVLEELIVKQTGTDIQFWHFFTVPVIQLKNIYVYIYTILGTMETNMQVTFYVCDARNSLKK